MLYFSVHKQEMPFTYSGPSFSLLSSPSFTSASTPTPEIAEFSSLAIKTATTVDFNLGFFSPSLLKSSVTRATCPKQSVVPRPRSLSPSMLSEKGSNSCKIDNNKMHKEHHYIIPEQIHHSILKSKFKTRVAIMRSF
jgi:hypothetical protein